MEYQLCSLKIAAKELSQNKFSFLEKKTSNGTIADETKANKLCRIVAYHKEPRKVYRVLVGNAK
jgi:hypothetical protein